MAVSLRFRAAAMVTVAVLAASSVPSKLAVDIVLSYGFSQRGINTNMLFIQSPIAYDWPDDSLSNFGEPPATYRYLAARGHKYVRIGFNWDVAQRGLTREANAPLDAKYMMKVTNEIAKAKAAGLKVVLVLGNGCKWTDRGSKWRDPGLVNLVCGNGLTDAHASNLWRKVSDLYKNESSVVAYDLFNEPTAFQHPTRRDMQNPADFPAPYSAYRSAVNASIKAIRDNGDGKFIWVESLCCTLFHDFASTDPNGPWAVDPFNRIQYSQHMYPEPNSDVTRPYNPKKEDPNYNSDPGKYWSHRGYTAGFLNRLEAFAGWCGRYGLRCSIGEVGWPSELTQPDSAALWNALGNRYYSRADYYGLDVMYFGVQTGLTSGISAYGFDTNMGWAFPAPGINRGYSQTVVIEKPEHLSR